MQQMWNIFFNFMFQIFRHDVRRWLHLQLVEFHWSQRQCVRQHHVHQSHIHEQSQGKGISHQREKNRQSGVERSITYFLRIISLILLLCPFISKVSKFRLWRHFSIALYIGFYALTIHFLDWMTPSPWQILKQPQNFGQNCQKVWNFALGAFSD